MSRIVDIEPLLHKYDGMNEGTEFSPIHFINDLMALEQEPCEDCISREAVIKHLENITMDTNPDHYDSKDKWYQANGFNLCKVGIEMYVADLPSVTPKQMFNDCNHCIHTYGTLGCCDMVSNKWVYDCDYGMEQYIINQFLKRWMTTFNTDSATECFTAVQELKHRLEE